MMLNLQIPADIEQMIRLRAAAAGQDVATFVTSLVTDRLEEDRQDPERVSSHEEFRARLQRIIDLHPASHHGVDDSRESIYAGRGE